MRSCMGDSLAPRNVTRVADTSYLLSSISNSKCLRVENIKEAQSS